MNALQNHSAFRKFLTSERKLIQSEQLLFSIEQFIQLHKDNQNIKPVLKEIINEFEQINQFNIIK